MMISPDAFLSQYENASYFELLNLKNEVVQCIAEFEKDYDMEEPGWGMQPGPDVHYQYNLEVLGKLAPMLREAFNREYESGEKTISDYYKDMEKNS